MMPWVFLTYLHTVSHNTKPQMTDGAFSTSLIFSFHLSGLENTSLLLLLIFLNSRIIANRKAKAKV